MHDVTQARSAAEAYKMRQDNISIQIAALLEARHAHADRAAERPDRWDFAGDLGHLEVLLAQAVEAIGGRPETV